MYGTLLWHQMRLTTHLNVGDTKCYMRLKIPVRLDLFMPMGPMLQKLVENRLRLTIQEKLTVNNLYHNGAEDTLTIDWSTSPTVACYIINYTDCNQVFQYHEYMEAKNRLNYWGPIRI